MMLKYLYHARDWLGLKTQSLIRNRVIGLTWNNVAEGATQAQMTALEHEQSLLGHLTDYLALLWLPCIQGPRLYSCQHDLRLPLAGIR